MPHISEPLLQAYLDGFCSDARVSEIDAHLATCAECRARLEDAQGAAQKASQLLGALEPGPIHAPSFEELQQRAAGEKPDAESVAAALEMAKVVATEATPKRTSWVRQPALAWAATVVVAFGVGWFSRSGVNLPEELRENRSAPVVTGPAPSEPEAPTDGRFREGVASKTEAQLSGELDDVQAADRSDAALPEEEPAPATPIPEPVRQEVDAVGQAAVASELRRSQEEALPAAASPTPARQQPADEQFSAALAESVTADTLTAGFADAAGVVQIPRDEVERWLGAPPREIPELALLRAEIAPGSTLFSGDPGRTVVRLVYLARTGQEIALEQQYHGNLAGQQLAQNAPAEASEAGRAGERERAAGAARANRRVAADRDAPAASATAAVPELPATVIEPDGLVTYTWLDADGYLMSVSAALDAETVRGLADIVR